MLCVRPNPSKFQPMRVVELKKRPITGLETENSSSPRFVSETVPQLRKTVPFCAISSPVHTQAHCVCGTHRLTQHHHHHHRLTQHHHHSRNHLLTQHNHHPHRLTQHHHHPQQQ